MKKLVSIFVLSSFVIIFGCQQQPKGPSQEEFDKLQKELADKDAMIAQLQNDMQLLQANFDQCAAERDSLLALTTKKAGTTKPQTQKPQTQTQQQQKPDSRTDLKGGQQTTTQQPAEGGRAGLKKGQ